MAEYRNVIVSAFCGITGTSMDWLNVNGVYPCLPPNGWGVPENVPWAREQQLAGCPTCLGKGKPPIHIKHPQFYGPYV
jgi:hypothetical protein